MKCPNCGREIPKDSNFCEYCGKKIESIIPPKEQPQVHIPRPVKIFIIIGLTIMCGLLTYAYIQEKKKQEEIYARQERFEIARKEARRKAEEAKEIREKTGVNSVQENKIYDVADIMPEFPGGQQALSRYLSENVIYPISAQEARSQGRVICQFTVNKDGTIANAKVIRSAGDASLDREALRVIKSMPKWIPGKKDGKKVRVKYTLPINFKLQ